MFSSKDLNRRNKAFLEDLRARKPPSDQTKEEVERFRQEVGKINPGKKFVEKDFMVSNFG